MSTLIERLTEHKASYSPLSCKPMIPDPVLGSYAHRALVPPDDGKEDVVFKWHWPRGTFNKRMSALEIATFVMPHMPAIVPLLCDYPRVQAEFMAMLVRLATLPAAELDRLATWIKPVVGTEEDDLIVLNIRCREEQPSGPTFFVPGGVPCLS